MWTTTGIVPPDNALRKASVLLLLVTSERLLLSRVKGLVVLGYVGIIYLHTYRVVWSLRV